MPCKITVQLRGGAESNVNLADTGNYPPCPPVPNPMTCLIDSLFVKILSINTIVFEYYCN